MKAPRTALFAAAAAIFAFPSAATAEYLVPPGNSAVNQYTEAVPTAGGHKDIDKDKGGGRSPSPAKVLGAGNARRLEEHGSKGREVAEVVAATAPATAAAPSTESDEDTGAATGGGAKGGGDGGAAGGNARERADDAGAPTRQVDRAVVRTETGAETELPSGSSGFGEILAQATGSSSSGQMGLLLPLMIFGVAAWAVAFLLRQRNRPTS